MTIIAAYKDSKGIWYGSDTRVSFDTAYYDTFGKWKEFKSKKNKIYIASAGSARIDNLIVSSASLIVDCSSPFQIADVIKKSIISDAWKEEKDEGGEPQSYDVDILLIFNKKLFRLGSDLSVTEIPECVFVAIGSGESYALGCAFALRNKGGREQIKQGIQASIRYDSNCGGRVVIGCVE